MQYIFIGKMVNPTWEKNLKDFHILMTVTVTCINPSGGS